jgi:pentatricopeptide repeat protein
MNPWLKQNEQKLSNQDQHELARSMYDDMQSRGVELRDVIQIMSKLMELATEHMAKTRKAG